MGLLPALSSRKRAVTRQGNLFSNVRAGDRWLSLELAPESIRGARLVVETVITDPSQAHLILQVFLDHPEAESVLLTVNPHEAEGGTAEGRVNGKHGVVYQIVHGRSLRKRVEREDETWLTSWELALTPIEVHAVMLAYADASMALDPAERFHYEENNCARHLWRNVFAALPRLLSSRNEQEKAALLSLASRGAGGTALADQLGLLGAPAYPVGGAAEWAGLLAGVLVRHLHAGRWRKLKRGLELDLSPKRNPLLKELYAGGLRADAFGLLFGDKLVAGKVLGLALGEKAAEFMPPCLGVKELLVKHALVSLDSGAWLAGREELRSALRQEFPEGYVLKAALTYGSRQGAFFHDEDQILDAIHGGPAYAPASLKRPFRVHAEYAAYGFTSGDEFFLMGKVAGTALAGDSEEGRASELRAHSFEQFAVPGTLHSRWDGAGELAPKEPAVAEFLERFLALMPAGFRRALAFSYDLRVPAEGGAGGIRILEINTNRGQLKPWSDYLREPGTLGAHARLLRDHYGWRFLGTGGELLLSGKGNVVNYIKADLEFLLLDETKNPRRRAFWAGELRRNQALANAALAAAKSDEHGYLGDVSRFSSRFLPAAQRAEQDWEGFLRWARAELTEEAT